VFLRATQLGLVGGIAGSILSGVLALPSLFVPFLISGGLIGVLAVVLACIMPETGFTTPGRPPRLGGVLRESWREFTGQVGKARRAMVVVPGLVLLLGMMFCLGMWSEGFDRLWGAYLLRDISFPYLPGLDTALWFSIFAIVSALLSLASTQWATKRTGRLDPGSVVSTLLGLTLATAAGVIVMAASHLFAVVVALLASAVALGPGAALLVTATRRTSVRHDAAAETGPT
jgi:MFS transporter, DHA3 family, tetracycline resistance protein